jgi:KaiC/GvpD/RAD55 family RecA-like ATPase
MSKEMLPQPNFDTSFQRGVLRLALAEDFFASQLIRYLALDKEIKKLNVFNTTPLQIIFDCLTESMEKYKTRPSDAQIRQHFMKYAPEEQETLAATYEDVLKEDVHDEAFFKLHLKGFVQQIKIAVGFWKIKESWKRHALAAPDMMQAVVDEFRRVEFEEEDILTLHDVDKISDDAQSMIANLIPTLLAPLDKDLLGGLPRETFCAVLGGTNAGKSLFCISLACNAIRTKHRVLHISLEGMRNEALMRYVSNLSGVPIRGIMRGDLTASQKEKLAKEAGVHESMLRIHNMLSFGVTIEDLAAKCREIYKEFKFDMLVIDYSQLLDTKQKTEGTRQTQTYVHRALAAMAREFNCVVVSPIQATRGAQKEQSGYRQKKNDGDAAPILRTDDISEDINIARVAGVILTLNRTDDEVKQGKLRVFLEKQRLEEKNKLYGVMTNFSVCRLITDDLYDPRAVTDEMSIAEADNAPENTRMSFAIAKKEQEDQYAMRKKINALIGQHQSLTGCINDEMEEKARQADEGALGDEASNEFAAWLEAEEQKRTETVAEIIKLVKSYYPGATKEMYELSKESLVEAEKSGTAPASAIRETKEKIRHFSYLYDKKP